MNSVARVDQVASCFRLLESRTVGGNPHSGIHLFPNHLILQFLFCTRIPPCVQTSRSLRIKTKVQGSNSTSAQQETPRNSHRSRSSSGHNHIQQVVLVDSTYPAAGLEDHNFGTLVVGLDVPATGHSAPKGTLEDRERHRRERWAGNKDRYRDGLEVVLEVLSLEEGRTGGRISGFLPWWSRGERLSAAGFGCHWSSSGYLLDAPSLLQSPGDPASEAVFLTRVRALGAVLELSG